MERSTFFRGAEFSRLGLLAVLAAAGWGWFLIRGSPAEAPLPIPLKASTVPPLPPAETSGWFPRVTDKTDLGHADNLVYAALLERVRNTPAQTLRNQARRDVMFGQLVRNPARYRGLPIHLEGTARRVLINEGVGPGFAKSGRLYEAWTFTLDSQKFPFCLEFEEPPPGLNLGADLYERVSFDGYFLKLIIYKSAMTAERKDNDQFAPLLIGRLTKYADPTPTLLLPQSGKDGRNRLIAFALVGASAIAVVRVFLMFRRKRRPLWQPSPTMRPSEEVDPESLAEWLNGETQEVREDWQRDDDESSFR